MKSLKTLSLILVLVGGLPSCVRTPAPKPPAPPPVTAIAFDLKACADAVVGNYCNGPAHAQFRLTPMSVTASPRIQGGDDNGYVFVPAIPSTWTQVHLTIAAPGYDDFETTVETAELVATNATATTNGDHAHNFFQMHASRLYPPENGPLHVEGTHFVDEDGQVWQGRNRTGFLLFARYLAGEDIQPQLTYITAKGYNTIRVFGEVNWQDAFAVPLNYQRPWERPDFDDKLAGFFKLLEDNGLRCEFTVLTYADDVVTQRAYVQRVFDVIAGLRGDPSKSAARNNGVDGARGDAELPRDLRLWQRAQQRPDHPDIGLGQFLRPRSSDLMIRQVPSERSGIRTDEDMAAAAAFAEWNLGRFRPPVRQVSSEIVQPDVFALRGHYFDVFWPIVVSDVIHVVNDFASSQRSSELLLGDHDATANIVATRTRMLGAKYEDIAIRSGEATSPSMSIAALWLKTRMVIVKKAILASASFAVDAFSATARAEGSIAVVAHPNILTEISNEPEVNGIDPVAVMQGVDRHGVLAAYGLDPERKDCATAGGCFVVPVLDYATSHDLARDEAHSPRNSKDTRDAEDIVRVPVWDDEPIGVIDPAKFNFHQTSGSLWERPGGGSVRTTNCDITTAHAAIALALTGLTTYHSQAGLEGRVPGADEPIQAACDAQIGALGSVLTPSAQLGSYSRPGINWPLTWTPGDTDSLVQHAYASINGGTAYVVVPMPAPGWTLQPVDGWRVDQVAAQPWIASLVR